MGMKTIMDSTLTAIANAIRAKTGKSASMTPLEMPDEIASISGGGGGDTFGDMKLSNTATEYINNTFTGQIPNNNAFYGCSSLQTLKIPHATMVPSSGCQGCSSLSVIDFTDLTTIQSYGFSDSFAQDADVSFPNLVTVQKDALSNCKFKSIDIPKVASIPQNMLYNCVRLQSLTIKQDCTFVGYMAMYNCTSLQSVVFEGDVTGSISSQAFRNCRNCTLFDFRNCTAVPTLSNSDAFSGVHADAKIVVPDALYNDWIAANNWSTHASKIVRASDYSA